MVTLRRRPRLQRQCNVAQDKEHTAVELIKTKTPKKSDKENETPTTKSPGKTGFTNSNTPKAAKRRKQPMQDPDNLPKKVKQETESKQQISSRKSKRSRLDKSIDSEEVTKVTPDGLVYEVGRRQSSTDPGTDEFVLRLNNATNKKSKKQNKQASLSPDVPLTPPKRKNTVSKEKPATPVKVKSPNSPQPSKRKDSKSPMRLSLKPEPRSPNQIFKIPKSTCSRKQRVSVEAAAEVQNQEQSLSVCSMILNKKKRRSGEGGIPSAVEDKNVKSQYPLFAGISPIVVSKKEIEKLETLEKSMNLFECPMSPIGNPDQKTSLNYSNLALKPEIKSLPKRPKTKPAKKPEPKKSKAAAKKGDKSKKGGNSSLLKTPLRQTFKAKSNLETGEEAQNSSLLFGDDSEESADEAWEPKAKPAVKSNSKKDADAKTMDYNKWLEDHREDYDQYKDLELCVE